MNSNHLFRCIVTLTSVAIFTFSAAAQRRNSTDFAVVYTDAHFQGWSYRILPGDSIESFRNLQDGRWSFLNRNIESIEIHGEMELELWSSRSFTGDSLIIADSVRSLSRLNWDNYTASINTIHYHEAPTLPSHPRERHPESSKRTRPGQGEVILFEDSKFRGEALIFDNSISIPNLTEYFFEEENWNDNISSIAINGSYTVTVFERTHFQGRSARIQESINNTTQLLDQHTEYSNWNNKISSIKIERRRRNHDRPDNAKSPIATLFSSDKFRGASLSLFEGQEIQDLGDIHWSNKTDSLRIDPGYIIVLYEHSDFRGLSVQISSDQTNLKDLRKNAHTTEHWKGKATSLKVIRK